MFGDRKKTVGVIGLGIVGSRVAQNLREAKYHTYVWNRTPKPEPNFVASPAEMATLTDTIQIFVKDGPALLEVLEGMLGSLSPKHLILNHSTVHPDHLRQAANLFEKTGAGLLDAPFTGSRDAAAAGKLAYYVAGDSRHIQRAEKLLGVSGAEILPVGRLGNASILKVATNMISASTVQALSESLAVVRSHGLHGRRLLEALAINGCCSELTKMKLPTILEGEYEPHFTVNNMLKDALIGLEMAKSEDMQLPTLQSAADAMAKAVDDGHGDLDYSVLAERYPYSDNENDVPA